MSRFKRAVAILTISVLSFMSACTPEQIATYKASYGTLTAQQEKDWLALPDAPLRTSDGDTIMPDGSVKECSISYVNSRPYSWNVAEPAVQAFAEVARCRGWSAQSITAWTPFAIDVMKGESGFCPNIRRGVVLANDGARCQIKTQGRYEDAGIAQLIGIHYNGWLCKQEWICGANAVIATPWNSMVSFVALLERSGSAPWCYAAARGYHNCALAP